MSKEKNFELSIVKMAKDINYEKPNHPNNLVDKEEYKKIDMAIATSVALTNAGTNLVSENALPELLAETKKDTMYIVDNEISDDAKVSVGGEKFIKSGAVIEKAHTRSEEHPDAMKRAKNSYSAQSLISISNSESVKAQKGDFEDFAKKKEKNLGKTRKKENNISSDEVTGEPLEGNGDFHHKNKKTIYTDPVQRLNPNKGILVNKQTHRDIHKNNINNEEDLNKYIKERRESK